MTKPWPQHPLADIAQPISRTVAVVPGQDYRTIGVKWWFPNGSLADKDSRVLVEVRRRGGFFFAAFAKTFASTAFNQGGCRLTLKSG